MDHRGGFNTLGRSSAHRKATLKALTKALLNYERIRTTAAKAKEARKVAEKLITRARVDSVHNRRIASRVIDDARLLGHLSGDFLDIDRAGNVDAAVADKDSGAFHG